MRRLVLVLSLVAVAAAGYDLWLYSRYVPAAVNQPSIHEPYTTAIFDKSYPVLLRICQNVDRRGSVWWAPRADGFCYGDDQPRPYGDALVGQVCAGVWCWPSEAKSVWAVIHYPTGDTGSVDLKDGEVIEGSRTTKAQHAAFMEQLQRDNVARERLMKATGDGLVHKEESRAALITYLRSMPDDVLVMVGYRGDDGKYHALSEADLRR